MTAFFVAGIGIAVLIEFLLISKKNKTVADQILTVWMFLVVLHLFLFYLYFTETSYDLPFLLGLEHPFPLLQGVFLYLYVASVTEQLPKNRKLLALHFLPAVALYVYILPFFLLPADQKINIYRGHGAGYETFDVIRRYAVWFSGVFYVAWSTLLLRNHGKRIREQFADLKDVNLQWLQFLTLGIGAIWFLVIFFRNDLFVYSGVVVFVFLIGFFGVRQGSIFAAIPAPPEVKEDEKKKYPKSGLSEEAINKLHEGLLRLMTDEAAYKKLDLSINDLSEKLGVHPNYLSQTINQREKKNFYDFVNSYRIEEFKRLISLNKNQQYTLLSLAHDCGFSSKTSFNRLFKKATGLTPSEYVSSRSQA